MSPEASSSGDSDDSDDVVDSDDEAVPSVDRPGDPSKRASAPAPATSNVPMPRALLILVDDDGADRQLMAEALSDSNFDAEILSLAAGEDLLALLADPTDRFIEAVAAQACLILLDLNMPSMSGLEVLTRLKADATSITITVVMFTTSSSPHDRTRALDLGASAFLVKPSSYDDLVAIFASLPNYLLPKPR